MKPVFYAEPAHLTDDSDVYNVFVAWEFAILRGQAIRSRGFDPQHIHSAVSADEACALVIALNEAVESVLGK